MLINLTDENFVADTLPSGLDDTLRACAIERLANTDAMVALGVVSDVELDDRLKLIPISNIPHVSISINQNLHSRLPPLSYGCY